MQTTIRALQIRGRVVAALSVLILIALAIATSDAQADDSLVAYAAANNTQVSQARQALDIAISNGAERANAELTRDIQLRLQDAVRVQLMVASAAESRRG